ncbi:MAG TPA: M50 family metallopeptidase [Anaerolineae bacterium]|nr:M50 family metallopeptidase [Anaerolineae bacterium]
MPRHTPAYVTLWRTIVGLSIYILFIPPVLASDAISYRARFQPSGSLFHNGLLLILAALIIPFISSTIHEIGHILGAQIARMPVHTLLLGPFHWYKQNGRWHFRFQFTLSPFNGLTACAPPSQDNLRRRLLIFIGGGPLASFLLALLCYYFFNQIGYQPFSSNYLWLQESIAALGLISGFMFLIAMRPAYYSFNFPTDANRLITLIQNGPRAKRWFHLLAIEGEARNGKRPSAWTRYYVQQAIQYADRVTLYDDISARLLAYYWALDMDLIPEASQLLKQAQTMDSGWITPHTPTLALETAYFLATHEQEQEQASRWLKQVKQARHGQPRQYRALAAVALANGELDTAATAIQAGQASLNRFPNIGLAQFETKLLTNLEEQLQQAQDHELSTHS